MRGIPFEAESTELVYGSVCSGIEAASVAWHGFGWKPAWFAEVANFPSAVLAHRWPGVINHGDFTRINGGGQIDLLVGGTPCQSFSVAGLRGGLGDQRGNLALEFVRLADRLKPRWIVWENVPGVLSSNGGRDFGSILGALDFLGYGFAYRVLDAQFFGVPQRRRRVFVVGYFGDWRRAATVLFERPCMRWDTPPRRKAGKEIAGTLGAGPSGGWASDVERMTFLPVPFDPTQITSKTNRSNPQPGDHAGSLAASARPTHIVESVTGTVAHTLRAEGCDASEDGTGRGTPVVAHCLAAHAAKGGDPTTDNYTVQGMRVRRLTPRECERLQGFPDDYTLIPGKGRHKHGSSDSARYKALGNSMAVPVMRWIGQRIAWVDAIPRAA